MQNETPKIQLKIVGFIDPRLLGRKTTMKPCANKGLAKVQANKVLNAEAEAAKNALAERISKLFK